MSGEPVLTVSEFRKVMQRLVDGPRWEGCPPHLVHPRFAGWVLADRLDDPGVEIVRCANLCGWVAPMKPS